MDKNGDGQVTFDEFCSGWEVMLEVRGRCRLTVFV